MDDKSPRHWHGTPGDRYEHHNVWVRGGTLQTTMGRRPSLNTPETPTDRRSSSSSTSSSSNNNNNAGSPSIPSVAERRRSSTTSSASPLFSNLSTQKRGSDPSMAERRASYNEQMQRGGFFSKLWDGYTKGN